MKCLLVILSCGLFISNGIVADLPNNINRCRYGDSECLKRTIKEVILNNSNGNRGLNLVSIDPLHVDRVNIVQSKDSPVSITLELMNLDVVGLSAVEIPKVIGLEKDLSTTKFEIFARIPRLSIIGKYKVSGQVLILPITGHGNANLTLDNMDCTVKFLPRPLVKDGKEYLQIKKTKFDFTTTRLYVYLQNLFNGDKALGDNMNLFINENWQDILQELKPALNDAMSGILMGVVSNVFSKFPYNELLLD